MIIINLTNNAVLADKVRIADNFWMRLVGLLNRNSLNEGEALLLKPSNSIHMFFMRFAIDALFLDEEGRVIAALPHLKPWRISRVYFKSVSIIELPAGTIIKTQTKPRDIIEIAG